VGVYLHSTAEQSTAEQSTALADLSNFHVCFTSRAGTHRDPVHQVQRTGYFVRRQPAKRLCACTMSTDIVLPVLADRSSNMSSPDFVEPTTHQNLSHTTLLSRWTRRHL